MRRGIGRVAKVGNKRLEQLEGGVKRQSIGQRG
jgi:hypothetical protein